MARVRCYAGTSYPERPVAFEWEGRWLDVAKVLWSARTPTGSVFDVQANGERKFWLEWEQARDSWKVSRMT
jgi:hypothetical protein